MFDSDVGSQVEDPVAAFLHTRGGEGEPVPASRKIWRMVVDDLLISPTAPPDEGPAIRADSKDDLLPILGVLAPHSEESVLQEPIDLMGRDRNRLARWWISSPLGVGHALEAECAQGLGPGDDVPFALDQHQTLRSCVPMAPLALEIDVVELEPFGGGSGRQARGQTGRVGGSCTEAADRDRGAAEEVRRALNAGPDQETADGSSQEVVIAEVA